MFEAEFICAKLYYIHFIPEMLSCETEDVQSANESVVCLPKHREKVECMLEGPGT